MTTAPDGQPSGAAHAAPSEPTAGPGRGSRWLKTLPRHVGRARTSTVVLGVLFLGIGALYLNVHPTAAETTNPAVVQPQPASHPTTTRTRSSAPTSSSAVPTTSSSAPTSSTPSSGQPTTSAPAATPSSPAPATSSTPAVPTVGSATAAPTS